MAIHGLIFDLDGTLIDSSDGVVEAVNYSLTQMGQVPQSAQRIKAYIGYPLEHMYPDFTSAPVDELHRHFQVKAAETVVASTTVLPGVTETLEKLHREGIAMAIATTKIRKHVDGIIDKFGWHELFCATVGGDEVEQVKPDPAAFCLALKRMQSTPEQVLVVGDTINDILAARAVPMKVAAVASPFGGRQKVIDSGPDFYIESLSEIVDIVRQLRAEGNNEL
jgi:2-phosphoglycolate phosphatase